MSSETSSEADTSMSPFERALGPQFHRLAPQVRQLHGGRVAVWQGQVSVTHGRGVLARLARRFGGFPAVMDRAPFALGVSGQGDGSELWQRNFDGHVTRSRLWFDPARDCLMERFGAVTCALKVTEKLDALHVEVADAWLWGVARLPALLRPASDVTVWQDEAGRYRFDISARLGIGGLVIRYAGWLRAAN